MFWLPSLTLSHYWLLFLQHFNWSHNSLFCCRQVWQVLIFVQSNHVSFGMEFGVFKLRWLLECYKVLTRKLNIINSKTAAQHYAWLLPWEITVINHYWFSVLCETRFISHLSSCDPNIIPVISESFYGSCSEDCILACRSPHDSDSRG